MAGPQTVLTVLTQVGRTIGSYILGWRSCVVVIGFRCCSVIRTEVRGRPIGSERDVLNTHGCQAIQVIENLRCYIRAFSYVLGYIFNMNVQDALAILRHHEKALRARGVAHVAVFGSVARAENRPDSDLDILVESSLAIGEKWPRPAASTATITKT